MKNINPYKLDLQLFAEDSAGSSATNPGEGQTPADSAPIDNGRIEQIVNSRADSIIRSVMKQHGLTGDELDAALKAYKEQKTQQTEAEKKRISDMEIRLKEYEAKETDYKISSSLHKLANDEGISMDKIPYLEKLISKEGLIDEKGTVNEEAVKQQLTDVLKAFPDFKSSSNTQGEAGFKPIGGAGGNNPSSTVDAQLDAIFGIARK